MNSEAQSAQTIALLLSQSGNYDAADNELREGMQLVEQDERLAGTIDREVQRAGLQRNIGFNLVRKAQRYEDPLYFHEAEAELSAAKILLADFVSGKQPRLAAMPQPHGTVKFPRRAVLSEHAATLGLQARLAHAVMVFGAEDAGYTPSEIAVLADLSGDAHDFSRIGNNGYYRTSVNVHGARGAWLNPEQGPVYVGPWLGRITYGLGWTGVWDRPNLKASEATAARNLPLLRSRETVEQAVRQYP